MRTGTVILILSATLWGCRSNDRVLPEPPLFNYYALRGSLSSDVHAAMNDSIVQRVLLDVAVAPRTRDYLEMALRGRRTTVSDLLDLDLLRREGDRFVIDILLFSQTDQQQLRTVTEEHARVLAKALLNRRAELETIMREYGLPGVDDRAALYIILGCFSLDWDGLRMASARGCLPSTSFLKRMFSRTVIYGWVPPEPSRRGFYKGSHNSEYGMATLTSFGDHEIQPRRAFPDLLWSYFPATDSMKRKTDAVVAVSSEKAVGEHIGLMMLALREGRKRVGELAKASGVGEGEVRDLADILGCMGYVTADSGFYSTRIPVLSAADYPLVHRIRLIGREELQRWYDSSYARLHTQLTGLGPFRYGAPEEDLFYNIWHDIFGAANRIMVEEGLFADPYSAYYGAGGIIPVVFASSLYDELR